MIIALCFMLAGCKKSGINNLNTTAQEWNAETIEFISSNCNTDLNETKLGNENIEVKINGHIFNSVSDYLLFKLKGREGVISYLKEMEDKKDIHDPKVWENFTVKDNENTITSYLLFNNTDAFKIIKNKEGYSLEETDSSSIIDFLSEDFRKEEDPCYSNFETLPSNIWISSKYEDNRFHSR